MRIGNVYAALPRAFKRQIVEKKDRCYVEPVIAQRPNDNVSKITWKHLTSGT